MPDIEEPWCLDCGASGTVCANAGHRWVEREGRGAKCRVEGCGLVSVSGREGGYCLLHAAQALSFPKDW